MEIWRYHLAARGQVRSERGLGVEAYAGLGGSTLEIEVASGSASDRLGISSLGLAAGVGTSWQATPALRLAAGYGVLASLADDRHGTLLSTIDLLAVTSLGEHVELVPGWRRWRYESASGDTDFFLGDETSDLDLEVSGLTLGLWIRP